MGDPIEAMARAITLSDGANPDGMLWPSDDPLWHGAIPTATAAYQALRETLVPVGWMYRRMTTAEADHIEFTRTRWAYVLTGWTETPLFALPEI